MGRLEKRASGVVDVGRLIPGAVVVVVVVEGRLAPGGVVVGRLGGDPELLPPILRGGGDGGGLGVAITAVRGEGECHGLEAQVNQLFLVPLTRQPLLQRNE